MACLAGSVHCFCRTPLFLFANRHRQFLAANRLPVVACKTNQAVFYKDNAHCQQNECSFSLARGFAGLAKVIPAIYKGPVEAPSLADVALTSNFSKARMLVAHEYYRARFHKLLNNFQVPVGRCHVECCRRFDRSAMNVG